MFGGAGAGRADHARRACSRRCTTTPATSRSRGWSAGRRAPLDYPEDRFREEAGLLDGVELIGTGRLVERLWTRPAISVLGIDAPPTAEAPNALVPAAKAKSQRAASRPATTRSGRSTRCRPTWRGTRRGARRSTVDARARRRRRASSTRPARCSTRPGRRSATAWDGTEPVDIGRRRVDPVHRHLPGDCSRRRRSWSPAWRTRRRGRTARTRACTWASSSGSAWPRRCCWPRSPSRGRQAG